MDGTLLENPLVKLPLLSRFTTPAIQEDVETSFLELVSLFDSGNVLLITNRNEWEKILWNSDEVLAVARELLSRAGLENSLVTTLNRQIPGLSRKKCNEIVHRISSYVGEADSLKLYSIEDHSFISPNRSHFLGYIARKLAKKSSLGVSIVNYVIRK
jgi:uncharacterized protein YfbU (UPF0304 family)